MSTQSIHSHIHLTVHLYWQPTRRWRITPCYCKVLFTVSCCSYKKRLIRQYLNNLVSLYKYFHSRVLSEPNNKLKTASFFILSDNNPHIQQDWSQIFYKKIWMSHASESAGGDSSVLSLFWLSADGPCWEQSVLLSYSLLLFFFSRQLQAALFEAADQNMTFNPITSDITDHCYSSSYLLSGTHICLPCIVRQPSLEMRPSSCLQFFVGGKLFLSLSIGNNCVLWQRYGRPIKSFGWNFMCEE